MYISAYASIHMYKYLYIHLITLQRLVLGNPNGLQFRICFAPPRGSRYIILLKLLHTRAETKVHHICKKEPLQHTIHTAHGRNPANQLRSVVSWWCRISSINSLNSYLKLFGKGEVLRESMLVSESRTMLCGDFHHNQHRQHVKMNNDEHAYCNTNT